MKAINPFIFALPLLVAGILLAPAPVLKRTHSYTSPSTMVRHGTWKSKLRKVLFGETRRDAFSRPMAVAVSGKEVAVADTGSARVVLVEKGKVLTLSPPGGFISPIDLLLDRESLFVSDSGGGAVWHYNRKTKQWHRLSLTLTRPTGLGWAGEREGLWITDTAAHTLYIWRSGEGRPFLSEHLNFPTDVVECGGIVYIVDVMDREIERVTLEGKRLTPIGKGGDGEGFFAFIRGIAADDGGRIYVSDVRQSWIQVFDRSGQFLYTYGGEGLLQHPAYMTYAEGRLWVADAFNRRVVTLEWQ